MEVKALARNTLIAFASQGVSLMVSFVMALIVPKALNVEQYGYWQLFVLYSSYIGFCHLGLCDGVYLIIGGTPRSQVDKGNVAGQFVICAILQLIFSAALLSLVNVFPLGGDRNVVISLTAVYLVINNLALYLGYIFQAMNETRLFSYSMILDRLLYLFFCGGCLLLSVRSFVPFIVLTIVAKGASLLYCVWNARDIVFCTPNPLVESARNAISSIAVGIKLMLANLASMLIIGLARFFIDGEWGIETFGQVSFSLSLVNFFISFVSQASMVLFPSLRQVEGDQRRRFYILMRDAMELLFPVVYMLYFPLTALLSAWLPQYAMSMSYFVLLLPICVFDSKMDICCTTFFKVTRREGVLLRINVISVIASFVLTIVGVYVVRSIWAVLFGMVASIVFRSVVSERHLNSWMKCENLPTMIKELIVTMLFSASGLLLDAPIAALVFVAGYIVYLVSERKRLSGVCCSILSVGKQLVQS